MQTIRQPAVAGMFYPANEIKLRDEINLYLDLAADVKDYSGIYSLIVPHAGYIYSGKTAACAYKLISNKEYNTVIIISPSHREYFSGISVYNGDAFKTPLGIVNINKEISEKLTADSKNIFLSNAGHRQEHAVEVQLPFLQTVLNDFTIVPVVIGDQSRNIIFELGEKLAQSADEKTLIVASSDLSHYHSKSEADILDRRIETRIREFGMRRRSYCFGNEGSRVIR
jgi:AmmeMemoRadiSam system protein B